MILMNIRRLVIAILLVSVGFAGCSDDTTPDDSTQNISDAGTDSASDEDASEPDAGDPADVDSQPDVIDDAGDEDGPDGADGPDAIDEPDAETDAGESDANVCSDEEDCDYDGLTDCEEVELGTEMCTIDTDGDTLNDMDEIIAGADPLNPDTDGDSVLDGDEVRLGLDPTEEYTFPDGKHDSQRWVLDACDTPASEPVDFYVSDVGSFDIDQSTVPMEINVGNWHLALPTAFDNYTELDIAGLAVNDVTLVDRKAAAVYDDPASEVAGFLLSYTPSAAQADPTDVLAGYRSAISRVGAIDQDNVGGMFDTHDVNKAAIGKYLIRTSSPMSYKEVRDALLFEMATFDRADATGLPVAGGAEYSDYRVFVSAIYREYGNGEKQVLTSVAIAPADKYNAREIVRFRMDDLTNTTNIAEAPDTHRVRCSLEEPVENSKVDFYWVLDQSSSMYTYYDVMVSVTAQFYDKLRNTGLDFRLGVATMDQDYGGKLLPGTEWHTDSATFEAAVASVRHWPGNTYSEDGLASAEMGITYMKGLSGPVPSNQRIRSDATLVTVFMTDDRDTTVAGASNPNVLINDFKNFFVQHTHAFIIGGTDTCGVADSMAYREVAQYTGGSFASVCSDDLSETIEDIIFKTTGYVGLTLPHTPISSSLRVYIDGEWVPRSRSNGFDYFASTDSIAFFGSYRPEPAQGNLVPDHIAINYEVWQDRTKPGSQ
jgi:hypothetical protein